MRQGLSADDLPVRSDIVGVVAYGAPQLDVPVRLNTNENPYPPSSDVIADITGQIAEEVAGLQRYPDRDATALRHDLAAYVADATGADLDGENVWAANGSNEVLQQLLQAFGGSGRTALGFDPSYSMHALIARGTGTQFASVPRDSNFDIDVAAACDSIAKIKPAVVFVCSPNNPTGTAVDLETISRLYEQMVVNDVGVLIVDEAYAEFSKRPSAVGLLAGRPRLIVTRTMSKAFAFAGARVGYLVADPAVIEAVQRVRLPYHLSAITQAAARGALAHADELLAAVDSLKVQRDRIVARCEALGLRVADSDANFVLFGGFNDQTVIWQALLDSGVLVRDVGLPGWLRVTAGTSDETSAFLEALTRIVERTDAATTATTGGQEST